MRRTAPGIRQTGSGWQAYIRINGEFRSKHFPPDTDLRDMKQWRFEQKARHALNVPEPTESGTLAGDAQTYLQTVKGMTTFADREYRIQQWVKLFGHRPRSSITSVEIRKALETWKASGLSHGSLNLRRTALMHLYTVLDGKSAPNQVKDVPPYREIAPPLRLPSLKDAEKAIAKVRPDRTLSKSRARLRVLLWTGWPASTLMRLRHEDVRWKESAALVHGRQKGSGTRAKWLPLLPQAIAALRELAKADGFGKFSTSSLHSSLHRGCDAAKVDRFRPYDLRHLFLTRAAAITKDDRAVAELAMHADIRQTRRYTEQSVNPRLRTALATIATSGAVSPVRKRPQPSRATRGKSRQTRKKVGGR